ncbi:hypothetical protein [Pseudomonas extremorientalis]|uniref:hypothetical protein n=1 Tax=Pseudomonas extremorientalis TaxID=169669 RepID=UPI00211BE3E4|nr:hypothetical protein [Pseudomonas extremorientalis]UUN90386.1 hypothetical protein LUU92_08315 [Pseudomonas extremorientalis]
MNGRLSQYRVMQGFVAMLMYVQRPEKNRLVISQLAIQFHPTARVALLRVQGELPAKIL